jgi:hypothetical protein
VPIGIGWSKDIHLVPFPGKFPIHDLDYGNDTVGVGKESVGEKTDFHEYPMANSHRISFDLLLHNNIIIV